MAEQGIYFRNTRSGKKSNKQPTTAFKFSGGPEAEGRDDHVPCYPLPAHTLSVINPIISALCAESIGDHSETRLQHVLASWVGSCVPVTLSIKYPVLVTSMVNIRNCSRDTVSACIRVVSDANSKYNAPTLSNRGSRACSSFSVSQVSGKLATEVAAEAERVTMGDCICTVTSCNVTQTELIFTLTLENGTHLRCLGMESLSILSRYTPASATCLLCPSNDSYKLVVSSLGSFSGRPDGSCMLMFAGGRVRFQGTPTGCARTAAAFRDTVLRLMSSRQAGEFMMTLTRHSLPSEHTSEEALPSP